MRAPSWASPGPTTTPRSRLALGRAVRGAVDPLTPPTPAHVAWMAKKPYQRPPVQAAGGHPPQLCRPSAASSGRGSGRIPGPEGRGCFQKELGPQSTSCPPPAPPGLRPEPTQVPEKRARATWGLQTTGQAGDSPPGHVQAHRAPAPSGPWPGLPSCPPGRGHGGRWWRPPKDAGWSAAGPPPPLKGRCHVIPHGQ